MPNLTAFIEEYHNQRKCDDLLDLFNHSLHNDFDEMSTVADAITDFGMFGVSMRDVILKQWNTDGVRPFDGATVSALYKINNMDDYMTYDDKVMFADSIMKNENIIDWCKQNEVAIAPFIVDIEGMVMLAVTVYDD